jgi:hypothetical protein
MSEPEFVGLAEIEEIFGVQKRRLLRFIERGHMPQPIAPLKCGFVFRTAEVRRAMTKLRNQGLLL